MGIFSKRRGRKTKSQKQAELVVGVLLLGGIISIVQAFVEWLGTTQGKVVSGLVVAGTVAYLVARKKRGQIEHRSEVQKTFDMKIDSSEKDRAA